MNSFFPFPYMRGGCTMYLNNIAEAAKIKINDNTERAFVFIPFNSEAMRFEAAVPVINKILAQ